MSFVWPMPPFAAGNLSLARLSTLPRAPNNRTFAPLIVIKNVRYGFEGSLMVATIRQPWGNRTQVCIVRPILPDGGRRESVDTVAKSLP